MGKGGSKRYGAAPDVSWSSFVVRGLWRCDVKKWRRSSSEFLELPPTMGFEPFASPPSSPAAWWFDEGSLHVLPFHYNSLHGYFHLTSLKERNLRSKCPLRFLPNWGFSEARAQVILSFSQALRRTSGHNRDLLSVQTISSIIIHVIQLNRSCIKERSGW
jgi:hypothetical protein